MTILKLTEETKKYFISSNLLSDDGIDCPDDVIANICSLVNNPEKFVKELRKLDISKLIKIYDFFDEYCLSKGTIKLIGFVMKDSTNLYMDIIVGNGGIGSRILKISSYNESIFKTKNFQFDYDDKVYKCIVTRVDDNTVYYKSIPESSNILGSFKFILNEHGEIISFTESDWGEFTVIVQN
jgi:hypothetical protein